jgi:CheY-like chemotaxis protein
MRMGLRVLLVEDDRALRRTLIEALELEGYAVHSAASLSEGLALLAHGGDTDLVLLDLGLPDGDGRTLLATLRQRSALPLIVISAAPADTHTVALLDAGADDYLVKPFAIDELLARMRVALRHRGTALQPAVTHWRGGDISIDLATPRVTRGGQAGAPHAHRVQAAGAAGAPGRPGGDAPCAAGRRVGRRVRGPCALPAAVPVAAARQAGSRPRRPALAADRARHRLPAARRHGPYAFLMPPRARCGAWTNLIPPPVRAWPR